MAAEIKGHVLHIVDTLENPPELNEDGEECSSYDWLEDALDIEYIVGGDGDYRGARVLVAFGGPSIWVDFQHNRVDGAWWQDSYSASFEDNLGIEEALEELWACRS